MPHLNQPLSAQGAVLHILIGVSSVKARELRQLFQPIPQPIAMQALVDTGASDTSIDARAFASLGLQASDVILMSTASASWLIREQFDVCLTIVHPSGNSQMDLVLDPWRVTDADLLPNHLPGLIGCDILNRLVFRYDGPAGEFTLDY